MPFLKPEYLYGLLALLIPILVHLFQLRRFQKQLFTNIAFLKQIKLQTRRSSTLKKWLILFFRLLAVACIVLAFAQPYIPNKVNNNKPPELVIYLDNSFSMQAKDHNGPMLTGAIQDIITQEFPTASISLFTNTKTYRKRSVEALKKELLGLPYTHKQLDFQSVIAKSKSLFSKDPTLEKYLIVISDFQHQNQQEITNNLNSEFKVLLVPKHPITNLNAYVKTLSITPKIDDFTLEVQGGVSDSNQDSIPVSFMDENKLIGKSILTKSNNFSTTFSVSNSNAVWGKITIDDPGPEFDNTFYFNLPKETKTKVLTIGNAPSNFLNRIFTEDEFSYQFSTFNQLKYNNIQQYDLIILNEISQISRALTASLEIFITGGGTVLFIPSGNGSLDNYNSWLEKRQLNLDPSNLTTKRVTTINFDHPIFEQAFEQRVTNFQYPKVESFFNLNHSAIHVLKFEDDSPFLVETEGLFVFSAPLSSAATNFINSPLIVPTLYGVGKSCVKAQKLNYIIGQYNEIDLDYTLENDAVLSLSNGEHNFIPIQNMQNAKLKLSFDKNPDRAGHYALKSKTDTVEILSFNYNKKESLIKGREDLRNFQKSDIKIFMTSMESALESVKSETNFKGLWKWFVIFALVFLIIEMLILKFFR